MKHNLIGIMSVGIGVLLLAGPIYGLQFSITNPAPPAGTPVALLLYGNQCTQSPSSPTGCAPRCTIYSCTVLPSASPGVMQGITDSNGNVQLTLGSYSDGSGSGFFGCPELTPKFVSIQNSPFYEGAAFLHGQWQLQSSQWYPGPAVYGCNSPVYASSSPYQFQMPITDYVGNSTYWVNVTVCLSSCGTTVTYTTTLTSTISGTPTTITTTTTSLQPTTITTTNTATSYTTYTTTVTGTQGSTIFTTTATVTQPVTNTTTATQTVTGISTVSSTSTFTQTITKTNSLSSTTTQTRTITQTTVQSNNVLSGIPNSQLIGIAFLLVGGATFVARRKG